VVTRSVDHQPQLRQRHLEVGRELLEAEAQRAVQERLDLEVEQLRPLGADKITAPKHRFMLIQMEPVSDRAKPVTLEVAVYEGAEPVTSIETVTFESQSDSIDERQKSVILTLQDREFDKKTPYRVEVTIDRAITDDFDF